MRKLILTTAAVAAAIAGAGCGDNTGTFTDGRDGKTYKTVMINGKTWMAENLNYMPQIGNSWCYENDTSYCDKYGRLYNFETAKKVCPTGWHLPTRQEWNYLGRAAGGKKRVDVGGNIDWYGAGKKLKAKSGWICDEAKTDACYGNDNNAGKNGNATDDYGFSALPGGLFFYSEAEFGIAGTNAIWWADADDYSGRAYHRNLNIDDNNLWEDSNCDVCKGYSVRCIQDDNGGKPLNLTIQKNEAEEKQKELEQKKNEAKQRIEESKGYFTDLRDGRKYRVVEIGGKTWMAENLNYNMSCGSWCYNDSISYCDKYGRLYSWESAKTACPLGWRLPSDQDWDSLTRTVGGKKDSLTLPPIAHGFPVNTSYFWHDAGGKLKARNGWGRNGNGTDDYGFSAMPSGGHQKSGGTDYFNGIDYVGAWWTVTEYGKTKENGRFAYSRSIGSDYGNIYEGKGRKGNGYSVRCVADLP